MTTPFEDPELDRLFQAALDQTLTDEQVRRLEQILLSDPRARSDYLQLTELDHLLTLCYHEESADRKVVAPETDVLLAPRTVLAGFVVAVACLVMMSVGWFVIGKPAGKPVVTSPDEPDAVAPIQRKIVATLESSIDAVWGESAAEARLADGAVWYNDQWVELEQGKATLIFPNGVRCAIVGHVLMRLDDDLICLIDAGLATFDVPPAARGFTVQTSGGTYVDLGTVFGVRASDNGNSEAHIVKGTVEANSSGQSVVVRTGGAVLIDPRSSSLRSIEFRPDHYSQHLAYFAGISKLPPSLQFWSQPVSSVIPSESVTGNRDAWLIAERSGVVIDGNLRATLRQQGILSELPDSLPDGSRVRSYLLHFGHRMTGTDRQISGSITFDSPVASVIRSTSALGATDRLFCFPQTSLDLKDIVVSTRGSDEKLDGLSLSQDRCTLTFSLTAKGTPNIDQARILVYEHGQAD